MVQGLCPVSVAHPCAYLIQLVERRLHPNHRQLDNIARTALLCKEGEGDDEIGERDREREQEKGRVRDRKRVRVRWGSK